MPKTTTTRRAATAPTPPLDRSTIPVVGARLFLQRDSESLRRFRYREEKGQGEITLRERWHDRAVVGENKLTLFIGSVGETFRPDKSRNRVWYIPSPKSAWCNGKTPLMFARTWEEVMLDAWARVARTHLAPFLTAHWSSGTLDLEHLDVLTLAHLYGFMVGDITGKTNSRGNPYKPLPELPVCTLGALVASYLNGGQNARHRAASAVVDARRVLWSLEARADLAPKEIP